jgi:hypothetical protein
MKCYGRDFGKLTGCVVCQNREWCRSAGDLELMTEKKMVLPLNEEILDNSGIVAVADEKPAAVTYSREELLEVIVFMLALDEQTLLMLEEKIANPSLTFSAMARQRKVSRQAIHKMICKKCLEVPELAAILRNRQRHCV